MDTSWQVGVSSDSRRRKISVMRNLVLEKLAKGCTDKATKDSLEVAVIDLEKEAWNRASNEAEYRQRVNEYLKKLIYEAKSPSPAAAATLPNGGRTESEERTPSTPSAPRDEVTQTRNTKTVSTPEEEVVGGPKKVVCSDGTVKHEGTLEMLCPPAEDSKTPDEGRGRSTTGHTSSDAVDAKRSLLRSHRRHQRHDLGDKALDEAQGEPQKTPAEIKKEREAIHAFWSSISHEERLQLVRVRKEDILKQIREQHKSLCTCPACGRQRRQLEEELDLMFDTYCKEIEYPMDKGGGAKKLQIAAPTFDKHDPPEVMAFGKSLVVTNGVLSVDETKLKAFGDAFANIVDTVRQWKGLRPEDEEENPEDMTADERTEEGRRMFQTFTAKLFRTKILIAYKEKVALENESKLLEEENEEQQRKSRKTAKGKEKKQKRREQKRLEQEEAERKRLEKEREEQERLDRERRERRAREEQERKAREEARRQREEEERKRIEEERKRKEEEDRRLREEEKQRKDEERRKRREEERRRREEEQRKREKEEHERREEEKRRKAEERLKEYKALQEAKRQAEEEASRRRQQMEQRRAVEEERRRTEEEERRKRRAWEADQVRKAEEALHRAGGAIPPPMVPPSPQHHDTGEDEELKGLLETLGVGSSTTTHDEIPLAQGPVVAPYVSMPMQGYPAPSDPRHSTTPRSAFHTFQRDYAAEQLTAHVTPFSVTPTGTLPPTYGVPSTTATAHLPPTNYNQPLPYSKPLPVTTPPLPSSLTPILASRHTDADSNRMKAQLETAFHAVCTKYGNREDLFPVSMHKWWTLMLMEDHTLDLKVLQPSKTLALFLKDMAEQEFILLGYPDLRNLSDPHVMEVIKCDRLCPICCSNQAEVQSIPCGHTVCEECSKRLRADSIRRPTAGAVCPFCRESVKGFTSLHRPPSKPPLSVAADTVHSAPSTPHGHTEPTPLASPREVPNTSASPVPSSSPLLSPWIVDGTDNRVDSGGSVPGSRSLFNLSSRPSMWSANAANGNGWLGTAPQPSQASTQVPPLNPWAFGQQAAAPSRPPPPVRSHSWDVPARDLEQVEEEGDWLLEESNDALNDETFGSGAVRVDPNSTLGSLASWTAASGIGGGGGGGEVNNPTEGNWSRDDNGARVPTSQGPTRKWTVRGGGMH